MNLMNLKPNVVNNQKLITCVDSLFHDKCSFFHPTHYITYGPLGTIRNFALKIKKYQFQSERPVAIST